MGSYNTYLLLYIISALLALLGNAINQRMNLICPDDPCGANADATFNLLQNDWVLYIIGCRGLKKKDNGCTAFDASLSHQFRPIAFALGTSEIGAVYKMLFGLTCEFLQWLYDFKWSVSAMYQDHSEAGVKAAIETSSCSITLCWPHI